MGDARKYFNASGFTQFPSVTYTLYVFNFKGWSTVIGGGENRGGPHHADRWWLLRRRCRRNVVHIRFSGLLQRLHLQVSNFYNQRNPSKTCIIQKEVNMLDALFWNPTGHLSTWMETLIKSIQELWITTTCLICSLQSRSFHWFLEQCAFCAISDSYFP